MTQPKLITPTNLGSLDNLINLHLEYFESVGQTAIGIKKAIESKKYIFKELLVDGSFSGYIIYRVTETNTIYLSFMAIAKNYQGRGLGRHLMESLLVFATLKEIKTIELETRPQFEAAHRIYEAYGFSILSEREDGFSVLVKYHLKL